MQGEKSSIEKREISEKENKNDEYLLMYNKDVQKVFSSIKR